MRKDQVMVSSIMENPNQAALIAKLTKSRFPERNFSTERDTETKIDRAGIDQISQDSMKKAEDSETLLQLFPDMELVKQIVVSAILSPKDMLDVTLLYKLENNVLPADVTQRLMKALKTTLNNYYKFEDNLPKWIEEFLFETGSHVRAVIPESSVDAVINGSKKIALESLDEIFTSDSIVRNIGILGPSKLEKTIRYGTESFRDRQSTNEQMVIIERKEESGVNTPLLEVTDNFSLLKLPLAIKANSAAKVRETINRFRIRRSSYATENYGQADSRSRVMQYYQTTYKNAESSSKPYVEIKVASAQVRKGIGRPLDMKLPSESVIVVHEPGDPTKHRGYFVVLDEDGYPVTRHTNQRSMMSLERQVTSQSASIMSTLLDKSRGSLICTDCETMTLDNASNVYANIVEGDLMARLMNGQYGSKAELARPELVYRIMMARALSNQFTRLLFIPEDLVTYFAYKYQPNGIGKTLIEDMKILLSLRAILLFSRVMGQLKNSINVTKVNMEIDPRSPNPKREIEVAIHEIMKMRQQYFPLGLTAPSDLVDWIQKTGFQFTFTGHPHLPTTKFDFENGTLQKTLPDTELEENLRKQSIQHMGVSPEVVDNSYSSNFATTDVIKNVLFAKRAVQMGNVTMIHGTDYVRKIIANDYTLQDELIEILESSLDSILGMCTDEEKSLYEKDKEAFLISQLDKFGTNLNIEIPKPDSSAFKDQADAFSDYSDSLDKSLDSWIGTDLLNSDLTGDISNSADGLKAAYKAYFQRQWMAANNFMPELAELTACDGDDNTVLDIYEVMDNHIKALLKNSIRYIHALQPVKDAANKDLSNLGVEGQEQSDTSDTSGDEETGGSGFDNGFDMGEDTDEEPDTEQDDGDVEN